MSVFGISSTARNGLPLPWRCERCRQRTLTGSCAYQHVHVFAVPFLPLRRVDGIVCGFCRHAVEGRSVPVDDRPRVRRANRGIGRPAWHYVWPAVLLMLVVVS